MSEPNSKKERPTSSKLEVRIPQATNLEEQPQNEDNTNPPQDGANLNSNIEIQGTNVKVSSPEKHEPDTDDLQSPEAKKEILHKEMTEVAQNLRNVGHETDENWSKRQDNGQKSNEVTDLETEKENSEINTQEDKNSEHKTKEPVGSKLNGEHEQPTIHQKENLTGNTDDHEQGAQTNEAGNESQSPGSRNSQMAEETRLKEQYSQGEKNQNENTSTTTKAEYIQNKYEAESDKVNLTPQELSKTIDTHKEDESSSNQASSKRQRPRTPTDAQNEDSNGNQAIRNEKISNIKQPTTPPPTAEQKTETVASEPSSHTKENLQQNSHNDIEKTLRTEELDPSRGILQNENSMSQDKVLKQAVAEENEENQMRAQSAISTTSQRETRRSSAASSRNLEAMQAVLNARKESGTGFVFSSELDQQQSSHNDNEGQEGSREITPRDPPDGENEQEESAGRQNRLSSSTGKRFSQSEERVYMTETPDKMFGIDPRETTSVHTYSPAYIDTAAREAPDGGSHKAGRRIKKSKRDRERERVLSRLNLSKPIPKYALNLRPMKPDPDPSNKAPLNPNIYYAEVPKHGGVVKTPFYAQVDIPNGALDGDVRLKFERQEFDRMKLGLTEDDTLCSCIIDLNMEPLSYCLRQNATIRMRILDKCINQFEETVIIFARHFSWSRIPTRIEARNVNGEKHYYAVTESQVFGKFAVINTQKMDHFVITKAGGNFQSTIAPGIKIHVEEDQLSPHPPQMVEMIVRDTKDEAVKRAREEMPSVKGAHGKLVGASQLIEISKDVMAQSGKMKHGIRFPEPISLSLPVPMSVMSQSNQGTKRALILRKHTNPQYNTIDGYRHYPNAYSKNAGHMWKDITKANRMAVDSVSFLPEEKLSLEITAPGKYMVLVFEDNLDSEEAATDFDLDDIANGIAEKNREHEINIMIHQKISQPSIITIHVVTSDAVEPISRAMASSKTWEKSYESKQLLMHEWQPIKIKFKGDMQLTVNQMTPEIRFYSKRWQGYQFQLEATKEAFVTTSEKFLGNIIFLEQGSHSLRKTKSQQNVENEERCICEAEISIERAKATPFRPTVVVKDVPKVPIYREYKMQWLKHLSEEDIERYKAAHGI